MRYNRIKAALADKGVNNKFLEDKLNVNSSTVSRWCSNNQQPKFEHLFEIAELLNVEVGVLFVSLDEYKRQKPTAS